MKISDLTVCEPSVKTQCHTLWGGGAHTKSRTCADSCVCNYLPWFASQISLGELNNPCCFFYFIFYIYIAVCLDDPSLYLWSLPVSGLHFIGGGDFSLYPPPPPPPPPPQCSWVWKQTKNTRQLQYHPCIPPQEENVVCTFRLACRFSTFRTTMWKRRWRSFVWYKGSDHFLFVLMLYRKMAFKQTYDEKYCH